MIRRYNLYNYANTVCELNKQNFNVYIIMTIFVVMRQRDAV